ncbi:MAG: 16S rRNA (cytosine(1402)-N(4))-methyltransferase RsmH [Anaerolineaceae bacterium]|nr:16S rRNA (cytosine(1402)-N(4))-methyltransferase RsmH [Anaerolineaceae bacterium]
MSAVPPAPQPHRSVLYQETIEYLAPKSSGRYLDCTAGAGGHAYGILEASSPDGQLIAIDLDPTAIQLTSERLRPFGQRATVLHDSYLNSARILQRKGWEEVDGILLDLGVSSMQLDQVERGFSFRSEAPLDMRFNPTAGETAADLVNRLTEKELADVIWKYGEERHSRRIARRIIQTRPVLTTTQLAEAVRSAVGGTRGRIDPATRTFQAIRIAVNDELRTVEEAIPGLIELLKPKGRLVIISFHSLEDRLVKLAFRRESVDCLCPPEQVICACGHKASIKILTPRPVVAGQEEINENLRARSAKLRAVEKK